MDTDVESEYLEKMREHVTIDDDILRAVIIPKKDQVQKVSRIIKDHLKQNIAH